MKGFRTVWRYSRIKLQDSLRDATTYVILGLIFLLVQYYCPGISKYLKENGMQLNVWELYIWSMSTRQSQLLYLAGVFGVVSQVVKVNDGMGLYLVRMDRRNWVRAQTITLYIQIIGLNLFLLICFAIACGGRITLADEWSRAAFMGAQFRDASVIGLKKILWISYDLFSFPPNTVGGLSFLLSTLLGMVIGQFLLVCSLGMKIPFGGMVLFTMWILDVIAVEIPMFYCLQYLLPFGMGRVTYTTWNFGNVTPGYCIGYLLVMAVLLFYGTRYIGNRVDFIKIG